jgi:hypothetical protein
VNTYWNTKVITSILPLLTNKFPSKKGGGVLNVKLEDPTSIQLKQLNLGLYKFNLDRYLVLKVYIWVELL